MRKYILMMMALIAVFCVACSGGENAGGKKQEHSVVFNGQTFYLQYSVGNQPGWLNEYLPAGQNFDSYTEMVALRSYESIKESPKTIAQIIARNYAKTHPGVQYLLAANEQTGDGIVSYVMIEGNILEFNLFRTTEKEGIPLSIQYVRRRYLSQNTQNHREEMSAFGKELAQHRNEWIGKLDEMPVPPIVRETKQ